MANHSYPVQVRGVVYPSVKDAAKALKISESTMRSHISRGTTDGAGKGSGYGASHQTQNGLCKPITLGGKTFSSYSALSRFLGMSNGYVAEALRRNQYGRVIKAFQRAVERDHKAAAKKALDDMISS